ncbi:M23 family metallopeptidase [Parabacteroides sp. FAFU027]|uniref:M23 family metallopeptidase n=1 Tax=Parabacteroides sp. FAFU027 TaxID=2922715 RepID=UPI001FB01C43|nr:M23 family metallopeptidase [Parabacteroides sp. FAFU027]
MRKYIAATALSVLCGLHSFAQEPSSYAPASPLRIPLFLAGNFGELRNNHFHSGIDFKTQGKIGIPVYSFDEGYVSRIMVAPTGNGKALYINHPNGLTSVYLHLDHFSPELDVLFEDLQYKAESYTIDHKFKENEIPVKKGQLIAYSGNSGSSAGPHLHFEVRDTKTEETFDPLFYFRYLIKDHIAPQAEAVMIYPMLYDGVINGLMQKKQYSVVNKSLQQVPLVWGKIALGIKAFDHKDQLSNIYGVKKIQLLVDGKLIYTSRINRFPFHDTRYVNSFIDYNEWRLHRSLFMKSYVEPGNKMDIYENVQNAGIIDIDQERDYKVKYILIDEYQNTSEVNFTLRGKKQEIPLVKIDCHDKIFWNKNEKFKEKNVKLEIPAGTFYDDFCFKYDVKKSPRFYADIHSLHTPDVPFHSYAELSIKVEQDTLQDKSKYYLAKVTGGRPSYVGGTYKKGWVTGSIREFGEYSVAADFHPPVILPLKSGLHNQIHIRISDYESGIAYYKGTIDGKFALFEYDPRKALLVCKLSAKHVAEKQQHLLKLVVRDGCGNESTYDNSFFW